MQTSKNVFRSVGRWSWKLGLEILVNESMGSSPWGLRYFTPQKVTYGFIITWRKTWRIWCLCLDSRASIATRDGDSRSFGAVQNLSTFGLFVNSLWICVVKVSVKHLSAGLQSLVLYWKASLRVRRELVLTIQGIFAQLFLSDNTIV
jgi:hypothetical protein